MSTTKSPDHASVAHHMNAVGHYKRGEHSEQAHKHTTTHQASTK